MKKTCFIFSLSLILFSCGPSQEEIEKQQRIDDSIHEIEREDLINKTNNYFDSDTTQRTNNDTIKQ